MGICDRRFVHGEFTLAMFNDFIYKFYSGEYKHQRLGQAFMNNYVMGNYPDAELFYSTDNDKSMQMIIEYYITED